MRHELGKIIGSAEGFKLFHPLSAYYVKKTWVLLARLAYN